MNHKNAAGMYEAVVDGSTYEFQKWGAEEATDTLFDLVSIVGEPLGVAIAAFTGGDGLSLEKAIDPDMVKTVMKSLTERMGKDKVLCKALVKKFSSERVMCEGKKINFDKHYEDNLIHMFKVVQAGVEVQYGNFLGALTGLVGQTAGAALKEK